MSSTDSYRSLRGGAWGSSIPGFVRAAFRFDFVVSHRDTVVGFRCVL